MSVRREIDEQIGRERPWGNRPTLLAARIKAVAEAQRVRAERADESADYVLRQSLLDLASVAELAAADLEPARRQTLTAKGPPLRTALRHTHE